jgi:hypothetical protein
MNTHFLKDLTERTVATFVEVFLAVFLAFGDIEGAEFITWNNTKAALIGAGLAAAKGILASLKGRRDSASLAE